jgi:hypothetical protein
VEISLLSHAGLPELLPQVDRTPDVPHVSHLIKAHCLALGLYNTLDIHDAFTPEELSAMDEQRRTRMEMGAIFEHARASQYHHSNSERYSVPPEMEHEGIYGHMDMFDEWEGAVHEFKFTWKSSRQPITDDKFSPYLWQLLAYCHMVGADLGYLHILHVRGDYSSRGHDGMEKVEYRPYRVKMNLSDRLDNWQFLRNAL